MVLVDQAVQALLTQDVSRASGGRLDCSELATSIGWQVILITRSQWALALGQR